MTLELDYDNYKVKFNLAGVPVVNNFVDREVELAELEQALLPTTANDMRRKVFVLYGLGGAGKTQLALQLARKHQDTFSAVFWLNGSSKDRVRQSIAELARQLPKDQVTEASRDFKGSGDKVERVVEEVMRWFSQQGNSRWLLIFDNVDREYPSPSQDPEAYDVERFFPGADHGSILITSRLSPLAPLGASLKLTGVDQIQGRQILELRAGKALDGIVLHRSLEDLS